MQSEPQDLAWLDARLVIDASELARMSGLSVRDVEELVDYGLLSPSGGNAAARDFSAACVPPLRQASELRSRFDLDLFAAGLMFSQFEQLARLERQVRALQAHVDHASLSAESAAPWHEPRT